MSKLDNKSELIGEAGSASLQGASIKPAVITMSAADHKALVDRISNLEKGIASESVLDEPTERHVWVRLNEGSPIIDVDKITTERNDRGDDVLWIKVLVKENGKKKEVDLEYLKYLKADKVLCKIENRKQEEVRVTQGYTEKTEVVGYSTVATGLKVPVRIILTKDTFTVSLPNGDMVELNESAVN